MIYQMFSVLDKAVGAFLPPMFFRSKGEALRAFSAAVNSEDHQFSKHVGDFSLYFLGEFDDGGARFAAIDGVRIITAVECLVDDPFKEDTRIKAGNGPRLAG